MAKTPRPWYRKARKSWFVIINGQRHNLGRDKKQAFALYHQLMRQPAEQKLARHAQPNTLRTSGNHYIHAFRPVLPWLSIR